MIVCGHALDVLKKMPSKFVHMGTTSIPYLGLRCYGTDPIVWGGDPACEHVWKETHPPGYRCSDTNPGSLQHKGNKNREKLTSCFCSKCGAWSGELGLEPTPELYVSHITDIFREFRRVLRDDGILLLNVGDSYARNPKKGGSGTPTGRNGRGEDYPGGSLGGYKEKDLLEIPSLIASSLRADGWYLRSRIPWIKRSAMPSSVTDRPGSSIEYFFLLAKSGNTTFWTHPSKPGVRSEPEPEYIFKNRCTGEVRPDAPDNWKELFYIDPEDGEEKRVWKRRNLWIGHDYFYDYVAGMQQASDSYNNDKRPRGELRQRCNPGGKYPNEGQYKKIQKKQDGVGNNTYTGFNDRYVPNGLGLRFMRDSDFFFRTWQGLLHNEDGEPMALVVNPKPFKGAHFACFPPRIVEALIAVGTSEKGVCPVCGAPWSRVADRDGKTFGWLPTCSCDADFTVPATVMDPFSGAGSTGVACKVMGRRYIGIELNPEYVKISEERIANADGS